MKSGNLIVKLNYTADEPTRMQKRFCYFETDAFMAAFRNVVCNGRHYQSPYSVGNEQFTSIDSHLDHMVQFN